MENTKKDILWRLYLVFAGILLTGALIVGQIVNIQFVHGDEYRAMAETQQTRHQTIQPQRGSIYADNGEVLATSFPYFNIYMDPTVIDSKKFTAGIDSLSISLSKMFNDKPASDYKRRITIARKQGKKYVEIHKKVTLPQKKAMERFPLFRLGKNRGGMITEQFEKREYPYVSLANRTIGYANPVTGNKIGLEGTFDSLLTGKPGYLVERRTSGNNWIPVSEANEVDPVDGVDVITTLDINMQDITEAALRRSVTNFSAEWGTAVVMEVKTGKIKAISNLTRQPDGTYKEVLNNAISATVEPGSTWKLFSLMCMFEDGLSINDHVDLNMGEFQFADRTMYDSEHHNRRDVTVKTAFALSSNVGISRLAYKYYEQDPEKYIAHINASGITHKTGVEISGERPPVIKTDPKDPHWSKTTIPWMSVGYELQITPLQLLTFYNGIANDGKMMKPYLVEETRAYGVTQHKYEPIVLNEKLCSEKTIEQLKECMLEVVDSGTVKHLKNKYYDFAGKTGTALIYGDHGYDHDYLASFVGYFPAEDPKYSMVVMISKPQGPVYYGGYVSAPVFREVADKVYSHFVNMRPPLNATDSVFVGVQTAAKGYTYDFKQILNFLNVKNDLNDQDDWVAVNATGTTATHSNIRTYKYTMPDVRGMGLRDAIYLLETDGLLVSASGAGKVVAQSIDPGSAIAKGTCVSIRLN